DALDDMPQHRSGRRLIVDDQYIQGTLSTRPAKPRHADGAQDKREGDRLITGKWWAAKGRNGKQK
ncbi:MAG: hypothetical protein J0L91_11095, partial [Burkholderiales bacterium]|nr:hypothetical protein [Burkholderiales bacterium]